MVSTSTTDVEIKMKKMKKYVIGVSILIFISVSCGAAVARALNNEDYLLDDTPKEMENILTEIRDLMQSHQVDAYIIYSRDAHNSEYVSAHDQRRQYVTNFTGSAGTAIITESVAALWTDSRYYIQAEKQLNKKYWILMKQGVSDTPTQEDWLLRVLPERSQIGIDPFLISSTEYERLTKALEVNGHKLVLLERNFVDIIWNNRPHPKLEPLKPLDLKYSGKKISDKVEELRMDMLENRADSLIVTALDDIAWLFNMRGNDILHTPIFYSYTILTHSEVFLFTNPERITESILKHFKDENVIVNILDYEHISKELERFISTHAGRIIVPLGCSQAIYARIPKDRRVPLYSLVSLKKAVKNNVEAIGMRQAHIRDAAAVIRYLHWLEENVDGLNVTELSAAEQLRKFRSEQYNFMDLSFTPISAFGPNAALAHYEPTPETNTLITRDNIYLIDSGGQYLDGTTDVTRSIHLGTPTPLQKECFTRVLKGYLALGSAIFPPKTSGTFFDSLARKALWDIGLDYGHGTGHGIGSYLGVHEYPPYFGSSSSSPANKGVVENMFSSNEPGYYQEGEFGIRIEDIVQVVRISAKYDFQGRGALTFYTNTLVPLQTKLIDNKLLTSDEISIINSYHARIKREVGPLLQQQDPATLAWLNQQTGLV